MILAADGGHLDRLTPINTLWVWASECAVPACLHNKPAVWLGALGGQSAQELGNETSAQSLVCACSESHL